MMMVNEAIENELCPLCNASLEKTLDARGCVRNPGTYRHFACGSVWYLPQEGTIRDIPQTDCRDLGTVLSPTRTIAPCWIIHSESSECIKQQRNKLKIEIERLQVQLRTERQERKAVIDDALVAEIERLNAELASGKYRAGSVCGYCSHSGTLLLDRAEKAEAIIAKLHKTDDGVPVIPGETYWCGWKDEDEGWLVRPCRYVGHCEPHCEWDWEIEDCPWDSGSSPPEFAVFSTREAAEAAGENDESNR